MQRPIAINCARTMPMTALSKSCTALPWLLAVIAPLFLNATGTVWAQSGPQLVSVVPADGAVGVATNSTIVFTFDRDMNTFVTPFGSISGLIGNFEIQPSNLYFTGTWGADKRTLTLQSTTGSLPFNTTVTWTLNPPGGTLFPPFSSATQEPLAMVSGSFTTVGNVAAGPAPVIQSVTPPPGAVDVSPAMELVFVFDLPMDTNVTLVASFSPGFVGNYEMQPGSVAFSFQGLWGPDMRTLTFKPFGPLPQNTMVNWTLNPVGTTTPLKSAAGQPLVTTNGSYRVAANTGGNTNEICNPVAPNTNGFYGLTKSFSHKQVSGGAVLPDDLVPAAFTAIVQSYFASPNQATNASLTFPGGSVSNLPPFSGYLLLAEYPASEALLESAVPAGSYTLRFKQSGLPENVVPMSMPQTFASVPTIMNHAAAQSIDAAQDFTLQWNAFAPLPPNAYITLFITDEFGNTIFQAPNYCLERELAPDDTSVVIPANYLKPGQRYNAMLNFGVNFYSSTNAVPQMHGYGAVVRSTQFNLQAAPNGSVPPARAQFLAPQILPNKHPLMTLSGTAETSYTIQRTHSLANAVWLDIGNVTMNAMGVATFEDTEEPLLFPVYYRAVSGAD